jgi:hypothetical protein
MLDAEHRPRVTTSRNVALLLFRVTVCPGHAPKTSPARQADAPLEKTVTRATLGLSL